MIPRILHQIWLGPNPLPDVLKSWMKQWRDLHTGWEYHLWTERNLPPIVNRRAWDAAAVARQLGGGLAVQSDLLRLEVLARFGGVYLDCDVKPVGTLDSLLHIDAFVAGEHGERVNNAAMGFTRNHPAAWDLVRKIEHSVNERWAVVDRCGPRFIEREIARHPDVVILPSCVFHGTMHWSTESDPSRHVGHHVYTSLWVSGDDRSRAYYGLEVRPEHAASDWRIVSEVVTDDIYRVATADRLPTDFGPLRRVVDVGANIGSFTHRVMSSWPDAEVIAVEAAPWCHTTFRRNTQRWPGVSLVPRAMLYGQSTATIVGVLPSENDQWSGCNYIQSMGYESTSVKNDRRLTAQVDAETLRDVVGYRGWDWVDLVKIDVEGSERNILESADIDRYARCVIVEYHSVETRTWIRNEMPKRGWLLEELTDRADLGIIRMVRAQI